MNIHEFYIKRCLEIAKKGLGSTRPNPMVGCVIVNDNKIIAEAYTSMYGGNHAEVNAIKAVSNKLLLQTATLYVTLEPCSHYGKTPPCADLIIANKIPKVVIGCEDVNEKVAGKGIEKLIETGCKVTVGVLEKACKQHHKRFFTFYNKKRPYIILKWAQTTDGYIAPKSRHETKPVWITNSLSRQLVHKWRAEEQAILVGTKTVLEDNPELTVRHWTGQHPIRYVIDRSSKLSKTLKIFNEKAHTVVINKKIIDFNKPLANQISKLLFNHGVNSVIIEGGAQTLQTFINEGLWDEARVFTGNVDFKAGVKAPKISGRLILEASLRDDVLKIYMNDQNTYI